jgi:hypothetical protein
MSENVTIILATAALNGAVFWGMLRTQLAWMRRDLDEHAKRLQWLERRAAGAEA